MGPRRLMATTIGGRRMASVGSLGSGRLTGIGPVPVSRSPRRRPIGYGVFVVV